MGIGSGQAELLKILYDLENKNLCMKICELGAQIPLVNELRSLFNYYGRERLNENVTAKDLYLYLGFSEYTAIDINGEFKAIKFDINNNLSEKYGYTDKFNVVTNFGTSEHCFNQFEVFKNMHNLCENNGYMLHTVPTQGWGKHCFYRYDKNFFEDLCDANNYKLIYINPFMRLKPYMNSLDGKLDDIKKIIEYIEKEGSNDLLSDPYHKNTNIEKALINISHGTSLFNITTGCIIKKINSEDFLTPIQGMYQ